MKFAETEAQFRQLKAQYDTGDLSETDFKARLQDLMIQDEQGRWWMIGYESGQWYVHDGEKWVRSETPILQTQPSASRLWIGAGIVALVIIMSVIAWFASRGQTVSAPTLAPTSTPMLIPPTSAQTPTLAPGATLVSEQDGMTLVYVPAGEFLMGSSDSDSDAASDEKPQHKVTLDAYWIDRTEVTKDQYQKCMAAGKCAAPSCSGTGQDDHPVACVSWQDATNYCAWTGRRLPTEAEWEKAARGTEGWKYPWGNEAPVCGWLNYWGKDGGCVGTTAAVGSYPSGISPYGALDMAGNVWEWVADWYDEAYYASSSAQNPKGPVSGQHHVLRGGSCISVPRRVRAAYRSGEEPGGRNDVIGFRCARFP